MLGLSSEFFIGERTIHTDLSNTIEQFNNIVEAINVLRGTREHRQQRILLTLYVICCMALLIDESVNSVPRAALCLGRIFVTYINFQLHWSYLKIEQRPRRLLITLMPARKQNRISDPRKGFDELKAQLM